MYTEKHDRLRMIECAIFEIAEKIGHSLIEPKSISLVLMNFELEYNDREKISGLIASSQNKITHYEEYGFENIIEAFRHDISTEYPKVAEYDDLMIYSLLRAYSKYEIPSLYPLTSYLKNILESREHND